ncbi:MAG: O-antigen ligase family protein [Polynucleobacter sp.]|uniref:O-antigen ligase family protein n=1 Tax=Polynucleobacter sp. TaxID=2029855 RepID=UPI00271C34F9|nr:O-antigen ligase family protein [Polynucleobacter sp.]MDO8714473.1 O-antigen ligase family protein [Polynucleobacter sp.]
MTLISGALIGVYLIYKNYYSFTIKNTLPLLTLALLFLWVLLHYFFFSGDPVAQFKELSSVWKRVFLSFLFAIGLGLSISGASKANKILIGLGFAATVIVFYFRQIFAVLGLGTYSPFFMLNYFEPSTPAYIPKYYLSIFIIPFIALSYRYMADLIIFKNKYRTTLFVITCLALVASLNIFYAVQNKNGILYFLLISMGFLCYVIKNRISKSSPKTYLMIFSLLIFLTPFVYLHIKSQSTWSSFIGDSKAALDFKNNNHWKDVESIVSLPMNDDGQTVSGTTYARVAWAVKGSELIIKYPLGYGLVINSFGPLAKKEWPDSRLTHSHSGWIDLGLALGIPGLALILYALISTTIICYRKSSFFARAGVWVLISTALVFISAEVAERILLDYLIFLIAFFAAVSINSD